MCVIVCVCVCFRASFQVSYKFQNAGVNLEWPEEGELIRPRICQCVSQLARGSEGENSVSFIVRVYVRVYVCVSVCKRERHSKWLKRKHVIREYILGRLIRPLIDAKYSRTR